MNGKNLLVSGNGLEQTAMTDKYPPTPRTDALLKELAKDGYSAPTDRATSLCYELERELNTRIEQQADDEHEVLFALGMALEHDERHQALALRTWMPRIKKWYEKATAASPSASPGTNVEEDLRRDAERYRYLRREWIYSGRETHRLEWYLPRIYAPGTVDLAMQLDENIDRALGTNVGDKA
jgi:hypothetical protein